MNISMKAASKFYIPSSVSCIVAGEMNKEAYEKLQISVFYVWKM
jgi:hypothetical protein